MDIPWAVARASMLSQCSSSVAAATEAMRAGVRKVFFVEMALVFGYFSVFHFLMMA
jgi:hypothetical protein